MVQLEIPPLLREYLLTRGEHVDRACGGAKALNSFLIDVKIPPLASPNRNGTMA
jgi:hypothetical protein